MLKSTITRTHQNDKLLVLTSSLALDRNSYDQMAQWDVQMVDIHQLSAQGLGGINQIDASQATCLMIECEQENLTLQALSFLKSHVDESVPRVLVLVKDDPDLPLNIFKNGNIDHVLTWPMDAQALCLQLKWAAVQARARVKMQKRIKASTSTAKVAMESASELGIVLRVFDRVLKVKNHQELAQQIQYLFKQFHLDVVLLIPHEDNPFYFPAHLPDKTQEILARAYDSDQRIVSNKRFMLMRTEFLVLLITNAPWHDEEKYGRYRDLLAHVVTLAEAKIKHLIIDHIVDRQHENIQEVLTLVRQKTVIYHDRTIELMRNIAHELEVAAISLDLQEAQEDYFLSLSEQAISSVRDLSDFNVVIESNFEKLLETYQNVIRLSLSSPPESEEEDINEAQLFKSN